MTSSLEKFNKNLQLKKIFYSDSYNACFDAGKRRENVA